MKYIYRNSDKAIIHAGDIEAPVACSSVELELDIGCQIRDFNIPLLKINETLDGVIDRTEEEVNAEIQKCKVGVYLKIQDGIVIRAESPMQYVNLADNMVLVDETPEGFDAFQMFDEYGCYKWKYVDGEILARTENDRLPEIKTKKIVEIKVSAKNEIEALYPDWKKLRHLDQVERDSELSMTTEQYNAYLDLRQGVRNKSNSKEAEIEAATTIGDALAVVW